jgi:hypothetical protein
MTYLVHPSAYTDATMNLEDQIISGVKVHAEGQACAAVADTDPAWRWGVRLLVDNRYGIGLVP